MNKIVDDMYAFICNTDLIICDRLKVKEAMVNV